MKQKLVPWVAHWKARNAPLLSFPSGEVSVSVPSPKPKEFCQAIASCPQSSFLLCCPRCLNYAGSISTLNEMWHNLAPQAVHQKANNIWWIFHSLFPTSVYHKEEVVGWSSLLVLNCACLEKELMQVKRNCSYLFQCNVPVLCSSWLLQLNYNLDFSQRYFDLHIIKLVFLGGLCFWGNCVSIHHLADVAPRLNSSLDFWHIIFILLTHLLPIRLSLEANGQEETEAYFILCVLQGLYPLLYKLLLFAI